MYLYISMFVRSIFLVWLLGRKDWDYRWGWFVSVGSADAIDVKYKETNVYPRKEAAQEAAQEAAWGVEKRQPLNGRSHLCCRVTNVCASRFQSQLLFVVRGCLIFYTHKKKRLLMGQLFRLIDDKWRWFLNNFLIII